MIYLNHAATSYPKPQCVLDAHAQALAAPPAAQFRAAGGAASFDECRAAIAQLMGVVHAERIFFTSGATEAMNGVLRGLARPGRRFAVTEAEHNSVLRPVYNMDAEPVVLPCSSDGHVDLRAARRQIDETVGVVVVNHCSNVTGAIQNMRALSELAHAAGAYFVADLSQSLGSLPVRADEWGADAAVFTGHKALLGPQGTGGFYLRPGLEMRPLLYGGTGQDSTRLRYAPEDYVYEPGTRNAPGIHALNAGARYILAQSSEHIAQREAQWARAVAQELRRMRGLTVYGRPGEDGFGAIVSFNVDALAPADLGYILSATYGIVVRTGLQCAPLLCARIGAAQGVVRASPGPFTTAQEGDALLRAVREISGGLP